MPMDPPSSPHRTGRRRKSRTIAALAIGIACVVLLVWFFSDSLGLRTGESATEARIRALLEQDDIRGARDLIRAWRREEPKNPRVSLWQARTHARLGEAERTAALYAALPVALLERNDWHARGAALVSAGRLDQAADVFAAALERWPDDAATLRDLTALWMNQNRWSEALALALRLQGIPPDNSGDAAITGWFLAGVIHHRQRHHAESVNAFEMVLTKNPSLDQLRVPPEQFWVFLGHDLLRLGNWRRAREHLENALKQSPQDGSLHNLLGEACKQAGDLASAETHWRGASAAAPEQAAPWLHLGQSALSKNDLKTAVPYLERAVSLAADSLDAHYALALAYQRLGRSQDARNARTRAEELRQSNPDVRAEAESVAPPVTVPAESARNPSK